ncbi:tektin-1-like [Neosynchiropus ocellatus]
MSLSDYQPQQSGGPNLTDIKFMRNRSELFRAECSKLIKESEKTCKRMREDINQQIDQHVTYIKFLKKELQQKLDEMISEMEVLVRLQNRVLKALKSCKEPLRVTISCLDERKKRFPSDRVTDDVDRELLKEREVIEGVISLFQHVVEQISEQMRLNQSVKHQLEEDFREKSEAQCVDNYCALMNTLSFDDPLGSKNTKTLLSSKAVCNSVVLRNLVETLLEESAADLQTQVQATTAAFRKNVQDIKSSLSQMEEQLAKIPAEYDSQQRVRVELQMTIMENKHFLNVAQARLAMRRQKLAKEPCYDPPQTELLTKVEQLSTHVDKLQEAAARSEEEQRELVRCQLELEKNIKIKTNSLYIDEVVCLKQRDASVCQKF